MQRVNNIMIIDEFDHYFRLCLDRKLTSEEARAYLSVVNELADVEPDDNDTVMVYHLDDKEEDGNPHCYDVRLAESIDAEQGDLILASLEEMFPDDDFDCESSMETVEEQSYLHSAVMEQLSKKLF
jgi:hypothetical protein